MISDIKASLSLSLSIHIYIYICIRERERERERETERERGRERERARERERERRMRRSTLEEAWLEGVISMSKCADVDSPGRAVRDMQRGARPTRRQTNISVIFGLLSQGRSEIFEQ